LACFLGASFATVFSFGFSTYFVGCFSLGFSFAAASFFFFLSSEEEEELEEDEFEEDESFHLGLVYCFDFESFFSSFGFASGFFFSSYFGSFLFPSSLGLSSFFFVSSLGLG